jgi:hypothetical protein
MTSSCEQKKRRRGKTLFAKKQHNPLLPGAGQRRRGFVGEAGEHGGGERGRGKEKEKKKKKWTSS